MTPSQALQTAIANAGDEYCAMRVCVVVESLTKLGFTIIETKELTELRDKAWMYDSCSK